jgi:carbonic anhydrase
MVAVQSGLPTALVDGYHAFVAGRLPQEQQRFADLAAEGQSPKVMLVGCCDSRVPPEVIFNARPGELFVVRNVANLVPPYKPDSELHGTSAALEFAVQALKVEHVVVMGHGRCGGIRAFAERDRAALSPGDFVGRWMSLLEPAAEKVASADRGQPDRFASLLEVLALQQSLKNLRTFPCVQILEQRGRLKLHGAHFDVRTGELAWLNESDGVLVPVPAAQRPTSTMVCSVVTQDDSLRPGQG